MLPVLDRRGVHSDPPRERFNGESESLPVVSNELRWIAGSLWLGAGVAAEERDDRAEMLDAGIVAASLPVVDSGGSDSDSGSDVT